MSEWQITTLGEIIGPKGYIRGPFGSALKRNEMQNQGIPVYEQVHAIYNSRNFRYFIDDNKFMELKRFQLCADDLIISCSGTVGKISIIKKNDPKGIISQALLILRPDNRNISPSFLKYFLESDLGQYHLLSASHGSVQPNIAERKVVQQIPILVPPTIEQDLIVQVLSSIDDKIDLLHRNNKTLEEMAETLFRQWFVDDNTEMWSTVGDEFDVVMGQSPPGNTYNENEDGVPFYQGRTDFTLRFPSRRIFCSAPSRMAMAMDTLLSVRAPVGDTNIASEECCIGRGLAAIRHKDKTLHYSYTFLLFNFIKESFDVHEQSGTVFGSISKNELLALKCPRLSEPLMFNEKIAVIEDKVTHNSIQIEALSKLRNTLLPKLMSGTVRVKH